MALLDERTKETGQSLVGDRPPLAEYTPLYSYIILGILGILDILSIPSILDILVILGALDILGILGILDILE